MSKESRSGVLYDGLNKNGLVGVAESMSTLENQGSIDSSFFGFIRSLGIGDFLKDIDRLEKEMSTRGMAEVCRELLDKMGIEVSANTPEWLSSSGAPVLFYGNHDSLIEPLLLGSLAKRDDLAFVANEVAGKVGENIAKHVLPVSHKGYASDSKKSMNWRRLMSGDGTKTLAEIEDLNSTSLKEASTKIAGGWAVGIFPIPLFGKGKEWYSGIGKIVAGLDPVAIHNTQLAPVRFENIGKVDLLQAVRTHYQKGEQPKKVQLKVDFAPTRSVDDFNLAGLSEKEIAETLRADYSKAFTK